jgi:hypothetical protein
VNIQRNQSTENIHDAPAKNTDTPAEPTVHEIYLRGRPLFSNEVEHMEGLAQWVRGYLSKLAEKFGRHENFIIPSLAFCFHFSESLDWLHQLQMKF